MPYMRKYQRVLIGMLADWNAREDNVLFKVASVRNPSDLLTKLLDFVVHWANCERNGLEFVDLGEFILPVILDGEQL